MNSRSFVEKLLQSADVKINGDRPFDIKVHNDKFYKRVISGGPLAFGESYMDGWWDCDGLDECINRILKTDIQKRVSLNFSNLSLYLKALLTNQGARAKAFEIGEKHYDIRSEEHTSELQSQFHL